MVRRSRRLAPQHALRLGVGVALALALALAASCTQTPADEDLPKVVDTFTGVYAMFVGAATPGPTLLRNVADEATFIDDINLLRIAAFDASQRPAWAPVEQAELAWVLVCKDGVEEGLVLVDGLTDAWDGSYLSYGPDDVDFAGDGTLRTYDDGTLVLTCRAATEPAGLAITRHLIVPGSSPAGRLAIELLDVVGTSATPVDLAPFLYLIDDGADDYAAVSWHTYGATAAFAWGTKDAFDLTDPAIGFLPLVSTGLEVDLDRAAFGDEYTIGGRAGATLASGQRVAIAAIVGIRGGFAVDDGPGKDAAMQALGADLAPFAGGAVCAPAPDEFFVWLDLVAHGAAIRTAICAGYAGL